MSLYYCTQPIAPPAEPTLAPPCLLGLAAQVPNYVHDLDTVVDKARWWVRYFDAAFQDKVCKIFRNAGVNTRYTALPLDAIFEPLSFEEKNDLYKAHIVPLAEQALLKALAQAGLTPQDVDCIISTSCTGHMSPSLDVHLMNRLGMKPHVHRLPVMEMGCIGGTVGLSYVETYLRAYPNQTVALICGELTSVTFQRDDFSWANIVSTAIFADGVGCAIFGPPTQSAAPDPFKSPPSPPAQIGPRAHIVCSTMTHFHDTVDLLGFTLTNSGLKMILDAEVPDTINRHFDSVIDGVLSPDRLTLANIDHIAIHPGGRKILHQLSLKLAQYGKSTPESWAILREFGNMSSATVLFILERLHQKPIQAGDKGLVIGFGPGFTASSVLLEWR